MIEYCTKKIMLITVSSVILLSVLILFFEDSLISSSSPRHAWLLNAGFSNATFYFLQRCLTNADYEILKQCRACTKFENRLLAAHCASTGYKEEIFCHGPPPPTPTPGRMSSAKKSHTTTTPKRPEFWIPCLGDAGEQVRHFLMFEGVSVLLAMGSYAAVYRRQRRLDFRLMEKVNRQIGAGV